MNKKLIIGALVVCLLAFVAVMAFSQSSANVRWEYTILSIQGQSVNQAQGASNNLGAQGWELVGTGAQGLWFIFKRPLQ